MQNWDPLLHGIPENQNIKSIGVLYTHALHQLNKRKGAHQKNMAAEWEFIKQCYFKKTDSGYQDEVTRCLVPLRIRGFGYKMALRPLNLQPWDSFSETIAQTLGSPPPPLLNLRTMSAKENAFQHVAWFMGLLAMNTRCNAATHGHNHHLWFPVFYIPGSPHSIRDM